MKKIPLMPLPKLPELTITVTRTSNGEADYVQIMTKDQFALNIVLISAGIKIVDAREESE